MKELVTVITQFQGIIGTLLGVIVTLTLTYLLKSFGKIRFYFILDECKFYKVLFSDTGFPEEIEGRDSAERVDLKTSLEIFNGSETPKILREFQYCFYEDKKLLLKVYPENQNTEKYSAAGSWRNNFYNINVMPKQIVDINIVKTLSQEETEIVKRSNKIYLEMKKHNGKTIKLLLNK